MVTTRTTTASELFAMGSNAPYELIRGELIDVSPSALPSNLVLSYLHWELYGFVRAHRMGFVSVGEAGYLIETDPDSVVSPDIAFVARDRMIDPIPARGFVRVVPDLIVEVISPTDERRDIERKQALYAKVGVPLVWWIDPEHETATVHRSGEPVVRLDCSGTLDGGSVLPGFRLALNDVFAKP